MSCARRMEYVSKLEISMATQNQLPSFHLKTQTAWMKANPLQYREMVYCFVWIMIINLGYIKEIFLVMGCRLRMNCVVPVV